VKFVTGLLTGLVLGAAGAVAYSVKSGSDFRQAFEEVRSDVERRDFEALGARLEARVAEMQAQLESRIGEVRERATAAIEHAGKTAEVAAEDAGDAVEGAAEAAGAAVEAAAEGQTEG
jgi:hypothetical protein